MRRPGRVPIVDMRVTPVAIADPPLLNAAGLHAPWALRTIVELESSQGVTGISEVPGSAAVESALQAVRPLVVDRDLFDLNRLMLVAAESLSAARQAGAPTRPAHVLSALEVACLDLQGKTLGVRVCDLLGGAVRERIPFSAYLFFKVRGAGGALGFGTDPRARGWAAARQDEARSPEAIVEQARAMCAEHGFGSLKLKGGALPPEQEVAAIRALRDAFGPDVPLRFDPNASWSYETALRRGRELEGLLEYYEDPVRGQEAMARLRGEVRLPLATNMCTTSFEHLAGSVRLHSEDVILADHHGWGGLRACVELGGFCRTFGRGLSMHSNSHLGISLAAMAHLAAVVPNLTYDADTHYPWQTDEVIAGSRLRFDGGALRVPQGPGLGVELDRAELARLHENRLRCGLTRRDDEAEMRKIEPGWRFTPTRW
jgi:glucarate dehydratase